MKAKSKHLVTLVAIVVFQQQLFAQQGRLTKKYLSHNYYTYYKGIITRYGPYLVWLDWILPNNKIYYSLYVEKLLNPNQFN